MSTMTKVFVVLTAIVSVMLSVFFISAAAQWHNWKELAENYQTQRDAEMTQRQNIVADSYAKLALRDQDLQAKETQLAAAQKKIQDLTAELTEANSEKTQAKNSVTALTADRTKLQETLDVVVGQAKDAQKQNQALLTSNMDLQTRNGQLNGRVLDLSTQVTILTDQARNLQEKLYAAEQRGSAGPTARTMDNAPTATAVRPSVAGSIRGNITEVNGTYAGINIGESSGLVTGMTMLVYRGNSYLGELTIDKVRPKEAGGKLASQAASEIRKGDMVWYNPEE